MFLEKGDFRRGEDGEIKISRRFYDSWMSNKAPIDIRKLKPINNTENCEWYECPCECGNRAYRPRVFDRTAFVGMAEILTCFHSNRQWIIVTDIADTIRGEEQRYIDLIKRAGPICNKVFRKRGVSEEAFAFLKDTHGINREFADDFAKDFFSPTTKAH